MFASICLHSGSSEQGARCSASVNLPSSFGIWSHWPLLPAYERLLMKFLQVFVASFLDTEISGLELKKKKRKATRLLVRPYQVPRHLPGCFWCSLFSAGYRSDPGFTKLAVPSEGRRLQESHRSGPHVS